MGLDGYPDFSAKQQKFVTYGIIIVLVLLILLILVSHHMLTPLYQPAILTFSDALQYGKLF